MYISRYGSKFKKAGKLLWATTIQTEGKCAFNISIKAKEPKQLPIQAVFIKNHSINTKNTERTIVLMQKPL